MSHFIEYERWRFPADKILDGNIHLATSLLSSSLEVNSFLATVECSDPDILNFKRNSKLMYYSKEGRGTVWRVQNIERIAPKLYKISATSTLGLLTEGLHYGGIYTGQTAEEVIRSICGTVPVSIKTNLRGIKLYGWLPIAAPRDNLAQVLFAIGAALKSDLDGVLRVETLWDGIGWSVEASRMYVESKVNYTAAITSVIVTEHQYIRGSEEKELYSGETLDGDIITFSEPMHSLTAEGFTILALGANWAKLSAGSGTLKGKAYIHNTREVERAVAEGQDPNVKRVSDATLVSLVNSNAVANRLVNFYQWRETIDAPIVYRGESPGTRLNIYHPFDKASVSACLQSADITLSNTLKAQAKSLVGFVPEQLEDIETYDIRVVLTGAGEWEVPEGVEDAIAVLIGGGEGGADGESVDYPYWSYDGDPFEASKYFNLKTSSSANGSVSKTVSARLQDFKSGKKGGVGGRGGMILRAAVSLSPGQKIAYSCGAGGAPGEQGNATQFGELTSALGGTNPIGYVDPITGEAFAVPGEDGGPGGDGGDAGSPGSSADGVPGGAGAPSIQASYGPRVQNTFDGPYNNKFYQGTVTRQGSGSHSGLGGGGAGGSSGSNKGYPGGAADSSAIQITADTDTPTTNYVSRLTFGKKNPGIGGDGAAGENGKTFGSGGYGGGGAGGVGQANFSATSTISCAITRLREIESGLENWNFGIFANASLGGSALRCPVGGIGGYGAPGCIILYFGVKKVKQSGQFRTRDGYSLLDRLGRRFIV